MHPPLYTLPDNRCACLVIPGLLAAEATGTTSVHTPYLCRLLSQAKVLNSKDEALESVVYKWFHADTTPDRNCAATLGYRMELQGAATNLMRADPVFQQMDINHAVLADQSILDLELAEAQALTGTLNEHFQTDGVGFELADARRWYCSFKQPLDIRTKPLSWSVGRDVSAASPAGVDVSRWRSPLAEIEMLLYAHPVNEQRQLAGKVPVNSLWLWGEGVPVAAKNNQAARAMVYSNIFYVDSIAHSLGLAARSVATLRDHRVGNNAVLVADDRLQRAAATADEALRAQVLDELEVQVFKPLWNSLGAGGIRSLSVWTGGDKWLSIEAAARYKFWRRTRPLAHFIDSTESIDHDR